MLTKPRLILLAPRGLGAKLRHASFLGLHGDYPAALQVLEPKTRLDRSALPRLLRISNRASTDWTRGEAELMSAFVSSLNGCVF